MVQFDFLGAQSSPPEPESQPDLIPLVPEKASPAKSSSSSEGPATDPASSSSSELPLSASSSSARNNEANPQQEAEQPVLPVVRPITVP